MKSRKTVMIAVALVMLALAWRPPTADIRILAHDANDGSPHRIQAAIDVGILALSLLVTWTSSQPR